MRSSIRWVDAADAEAETALEPHVSVREDGVADHGVVLVAGTGSRSRGPATTTSPNYSRFHPRTGLRVHPVCSPRSPTDLEEFHRALGYHRPSWTGRGF